MTVFKISILVDTKFNETLRKLKNNNRKRKIL